MAFNFPPYHLLERDYLCAAMDFVKKPAVTAFAMVLFGVGLAAFFVMVGLQRTLGGAQLKETD